MDGHSALTALSEDERSERLADTITIIEQWTRFVLVRRSQSGDEELWSVRGRHPWCPVASRLPTAGRIAFTPAQRAAEERSWNALVEAARRCSGTAVADDGAGKATAEQDEPGHRRQDATASRWAISRAFRQYNQAIRPRRAPVPAEVKRAVLGEWERAGRHCGICGLPVEPNEDRALDHVRPVAHGGTNEAANLRVVHATCNGRRGAWYWAAGAPPESIRLELEAAHPSLSSAFGCWLCGVPTRAYIDLPDLPTLRFCRRHRDWPTVSAVLVGYGVPAASLEHVSYLQASESGGR